MPFIAWRSITIDHTKVPTSNQIDFPVIIAGTYSYLKTLANGGNVRNSNGYDVGFYSDITLTTKLKWETRKYTASTGAVMYYVKVPTVSTSVDTVIYIAYGDASITTDQSDKNNVWDSNFKGVWHTSINGVLSLLDSSASASTLSNTAVTVTTGQLDGCASFNGTTAVLNAGNPSAVQITGQVTLECWFNATAFPSSGNQAALMSKGYDNTYEGYYMIFANSGGSVSLGIGSYNNSTPADVTYLSWNLSGVSTGTWYHAAATYNGTKWQLYINGVWKAEQVTAIGAIAATTSFTIGAEYINPTTLGKFFSGKIEEVKVSNTGRLVDYLLTEYNNFSSPSTFYALGQDLGLFPNKRIVNNQAVRRASFR